MSTKNDNATPLMRQYHAIKKKHPDKIVLFRMGDFYETFDEDAKVTAKTLGITLTKRSNGAAGKTPLAGFPHHALDAYLHKLLRAGLRVAICEQLEDPKQAKGIVKRDITEIVTPGTAVDDKYLSSEENNYLATVIWNEKNAVCAYADISTGEMSLVRGSSEAVLDYISSLPVQEILFTEGNEKTLREKLPLYKGLITPLESWISDGIYCQEQIRQHFKVHSLKGMGLEDDRSGQQAVGMLLHYIRENFQQRLEHLSNLHILELANYLSMDNFTIRNLELLQRLNGERGEGTLIWAIDNTNTPMAARLIRHWLLHPLQDISKILFRQRQISFFLENAQLRQSARKILHQIGDIERLLGRLSAKKINPRELLVLKESLINAVLLAERLESNQELNFPHLDSLQKLIKLIDSAVLPEPPININEGGIFQESFHPELPELRQIAYHGKDYLVKMQENERRRLDIPSLKIGYNRVFGYYIEITRTHSDKVPEDYIRKQTLVNCERYITPELKTFEEKILNAEESLQQLERQLWLNLLDELLPYLSVIQQNTRIVAETDIYAALAELTEREQWCLPELEETGILEIKGGRHPVIEALLPPGESFIPNDVFLDTLTDQILIITGPNMAGKSTYLRQIGLIVLLAHIGSYIPADSAKIGISDKIFTRVGASDNLAYGESTFLTEMIETANILNTATSKSLILLDEIGRGTSTYDGLSIAWAVVEYLHNTEQVAARTLFATHYHELTELEKLLGRVKNYNVAVREYGDKIIFLRKIIQGAADKSYGIYVAQMAGIPKSVVDRAKSILHSLSGSDHALPDGKKMIKARVKAEENSYQLSIFEAKESALAKDIKALKIEEMTPLQALQALDELKRKMQ
ncbi:MAG TPA: DNA mismatch repair protein MutS [Candidatus Marinimicrobia bacterium]|nr:DNA mismatch repair protein MutS [Candidatus Neomarinimicrobiota bacterium]